MLSNKFQKLSTFDEKLLISEIYMKDFPLLLRNIKRRKLLFERYY